MSLLMTFQSSVRVFGPFMFTAVYDNTGMYLLTGLMSGLMLACAVLVIAFYERLAAFGDRIKNVDDEEDDGP